jgi:predicted ATPase
MLQITLGTALTATRGYGASEVKEAYTRALELCRQLGETPRLLGVLGGLQGIYQGQGELRMARELGEQYLTLAQRERRPTQLVWAHCLKGENLLYLGEFSLGREHLQQSMALYDPQRRHLYVRGSVHDPGVACLRNDAMALWCLGYPDQALKKIRAAVNLAQELFHSLELAHSLSLARALDFAALLHQYRREGQAAQEQAEAMLAVSTEQGFPFFLAHGTILRGWALTAQGHGKEGIAQIRQGLVAYQATGGGLFRPYFLAMLAEAYGKMGQCEEGLTLLAEALATVDKNGERFYEAELYRLKGELTLRSQVQGHKSKVEKEAEGCFWRAIEIARCQQAKSLELRAGTSLSRLWQSQGKNKEAHDLLSEVYGWFTEGFETKDLQEARALLEELA